MDKRDCLQHLLDNELAPCGRGVTHGAMFGSHARGEDLRECDIDIMIEIAPEARVDVLQYVRVVQFIEDLFPPPVDVANRAGLKPSVEREADYVF